MLPGDFNFIIYEADHIAAAADSRMVMEDSEDKGCDSELPLKSIFTTFGGVQKSDLHHHLAALNPVKAFNYPVAGVVASADKYKELVANLKENFKKTPLDAMSVNEVLRIMEDYASFVPASTNVAEVSDISLFMHSKITAAVATSMKGYFDDQGITDYREACVTKASEYRGKEVFLMVSGDFSGIQDFIYTVPSRGALKSLRGRSVFLEVFLEVVLDELLEVLELSRANVIYVGGGHFYLLAPHTEAVKAKVNTFFAKCNEWLLASFGTKLYIASGVETCSAEDLKGNTEKNPFFAVNRKVSKDKSCRYSQETLEQLFSETSSYNKLDDASRECAVCHTSTQYLSPYKGKEDILACESCNSLFSFGEAVLKENSHFVIVDKREGVKGLPVFGFHEELVLVCKEEKDLDLFEKEHGIKYLYGKNKAIAREALTTRLWIGDYVSRDPVKTVKEFETLAKESVNDKQGINRLGVLRADVDNLGAAFLSGYIGDDLKNPHKYDTLTRKADLSRGMSMFFKLAVEKICQGDLRGLTQEKQFSIFEDKPEHRRNVHIIYAGGDDMFLVGSWDELLEVAVDIRRAFQQFTDDKLSFSAGLALFNPNYPITAMAESSGVLESMAKDQPEKNSLALFGLDTEQKNADYELTCRHVFDWERFATKVCKEKLGFIRNTFDFENTGDPSKLEGGKGFIYRLMDLVELAGVDRINLARFVYTIARMEPKNPNDQLRKKTHKEFSDTMYRWMKEPKDREELLTALHLLVYYLREEGER